MLVDVVQTSRSTACNPRNPQSLVPKSGGGRGLPGDHNGTIGQLDTDSWEGSWRCWNRALLGYLFLPLRLLLPQHAIRVLLVKGFQPYTKVVIICIIGVRWVFDSKARQVPLPLRVKNVRLQSPIVIGADGLG